MNTPTPKSPLTEYLTQLVEEPQEEYCLRRIDDIVIVPSSAEHAGGDSRRYVGYDGSGRKLSIVFTPASLFKIQLFERGRNLVDEEEVESGMQLEINTVSDPSGQPLLATGLLKESLERMFSE